jgi:hypothetical protein
MNCLIENGFKKFLGDIYHYKPAQKLLGGVVNAPPRVYEVNNNKYVVRIFKGSPEERCNGIATHLFVADKKLAPTIHYHHHDEDLSFVIMDFIAVPTLSFEQASQSDVLALIGQKVRSIAHFDINMMSNNKENLFDEIMKHHHSIKSKKLSELDPILEEIKNKTEILHQAIENEHRPLVINHNDFHLRNIFFTHNDIKIIDWDTVAPNYEFCDLALYSICSCLDEAADYFLLIHYLQRVPSFFDIQFFKKIKLMMRMCDIVNSFDLIESIPAFLSVESFKTFKDYSIMFAEGACNDSSEFFYGLGMTHLQEFRQEYRKTEKRL